MAPTKVMTISPPNAIFLILHIIGSLKVDGKVLYQLRSRMTCVSYSCANWRFYFIRTGKIGAEAALPNATALLAVPHSSGLRLTARPFCEGQVLFCALLGYTKHIVRPGLEVKEINGHLFTLMVDWAEEKRV
ncbi:hypothetical protein [Paraburkholderia ribeironis]|uniref:hypothetical protein n=1 Tax=Paraburkholderia ribeironis TaxID=1247936 RepID=UPI001177A53D|nr:hypothetical protein [Paraburkholderia ribeironis]